MNMVGVTPISQLSWATCWTACQSNDDFVLCVLHCAAHLTGDCGTRVLSGSVALVICLPRRRVAVTACGVWRLLSVLLLLLLLRKRRAETGLAMWIPFQANVT